MLTIEEVQDRINSGYYKNNLPYGESGSKERLAYHAQEGKLNEMFMNDTIEAHGIKGHPKATRAYALAWEHGHSAGHYEVFNCMFDYASLLKD